MRAFWAGLWARLFRRVRVDYIGSAVPLPPPLKPEEERALVEAIEAGDSSAKGTLIEHNLRLVVYIARKFENTGIGMEDLISTGGSSLQAVEALRNAGCDVLGMVAIFTYGFQKAIDNFTNAHCVLDTLSDYNAMIDLAQKTGYVQESDVAKLKEWRLSPESYK